jgi:hypothetical protein
VTWVYYLRNLGKFSFQIIWKPLGSLS